MPTAKANAAPGTKVADNVTAYCTACKIDTHHTVVAMKGDRIVKVQCRECNKEHTFKAAKGITERKKKKTRAESQAEAAKATIESEWNRLMNANKAPAKNYSMKTGFILGDKLDHKEFGSGVVSKIVYPNKIEVTFQSQVKLLVHVGETYAGKF